MSTLIGLVLRVRKASRSSVAIVLCTSVALIAVLAQSIAAVWAGSAPDVMGRLLATLDTSAGLPYYEASCAGCHGYLGEGLTGATPPLADVVPRLLVQEGGREYLVGVMLHGLSGRLKVAGRTYDGVMPSFGHLADEDIAAVLNHVATAWGNRETLLDGEPEFTALEIALARAVATDQSQLNRARAALTRTLEQ